MFHPHNIRVRLQTARVTLERITTPSDPSTLARRTLTTRMILTSLRHSDADITERERDSLNELAM